MGIGDLLPSTGPDRPTDEIGAAIDLSPNEAVIVELAE
jgi:hypothetical protein